DYSWSGEIVSIAMEVSEDGGFANANSFEATVSGNSLTVTATGLKAETTYYYRMRLNTENGKVESETKTLKTTAYILPTVTTSEVTNISGTKADCRCNVTSEGDLAVTARGVCWGTTDNPTIDDSHTVDGGGAGAFTSNITGLTENTTYYVRAYATSSAGTVYGATKTFVTTAYILPTVTTSEVDYISATTAKCGGEVNSEGDLTVTARGVCWSTTDNPTIDDSHTVDGGGAGSFISNITGLTENTTYYVRAYATSGASTVYGATKTFETFKTIFSLTVNGVSFEMVYVEGGSFDMGATTEQGSDADGNEYPVHSVTLSDYYIGKCEVTQELWEAVMGSNPSYFKGAQNPVERVIWNDCQNFIKKLNSLTGRTFRLPTEAEWEYAARGGNQSLHYKYSGSNNIFDVAWHDGNSGDKTHAVGTKTANELGIYDMSGNVWEWCSDWYGGYSAGAQTNPQGPSSGSYRVLRGGGWFYNARCCRVSYRISHAPEYSSSDNGLRLVLVP
ncbi:MAG: formylglycine-generating enzyme family protein, partial [Bacteroidales bacterium]|nr:formylglycine-generating enzyme family protein [Bacteroidales bacterium]